MYITKDEFESIREADLLKSKKTILLTDYILIPLQVAHDQIITGIVAHIYLFVSFDPSTSNYKFFYDIYPNGNKKGITLISADISPGVFTSEEERALFIRIISNKFFDIRDKALEYNAGFCKKYSLKDPNKPSLFARFIKFVKG